MNDGNVKQQIVDKIRGTTNILVTVSTDPSVDELSAALGLTILLNKMDKHATAVFSGKIPPAITFLDPEKTFENTVDSLRDFIIALDKEKADHLRYKVEGDVVKIFITPYRTTITSSDLDFSQGDYNVELVIALGVKKRDNLDQALAAHGRILHDATVVTIGQGSEPSDLGSIDWTESTVSSFSEMIVSLIDALKGDKPLLDEQIATALLTGIVAATDRFSNDQTSSRVMTMAAQLMGAGANQQLIASKLQQAHEIGDESPSAEAPMTNLNEGEPSKVNKKRSGGKKAATTSDEQPRKDGELDISHEKEGNIDEVAHETAVENQAAAAEAAAAELEKQLLTHDDGDAELAGKLEGVTSGGAKPSVADLQKDIAQASADVDEAADKPATDSPLPSLPKPLSGAVASDQWKESDEPTLGGTLNATTEQAAEDKRREDEKSQNHTILSHNSANAYVGDKAEPTFQAPLNAAVAPKDEPPTIDVFRDTPSAGLPSDSQPTASGLDFEPAPIPAPKLSETLADIDAKTRSEHDEARSAVEAAIGAQPFDPAGHPLAGVGAQPFGDIVHTDEAKAPANSATEPSVLPTPVPPLPPLPDFSTLPPLPPVPPTLGAQPAASDSAALPPENLETILEPTSPTPKDPGQFKIPGQS